MKEFRFSLQFEKVPPGLIAAKVTAAVRDGRCSGAEVVSAASLEARELGCGRCTPAAEPPLQPALPPPGPRRWPMRAALGAGSRLEPSVARRLLQPFAEGSHPSAAEEREPCREPAAPPRSSSPCASRGLRLCPASFPPAGISPSQGRRLSLTAQLPSQRPQRPPGQPPQECQLSQLTAWEKKFGQKLTPLLNKVRRNI